MNEALQQEWDQLKGERVQFEADFTAATKKYEQALEAWETKNAIRLVEEDTTALTVNLDGSRKSRKAVFYGESTIHRPKISVKEVLTECIASTTVPLTMSELLVATATCATRSDGEDSTSRMTLKGVEAAVKLLMKEGRIRRHMPSVTKDLDLVAQTARVGLRPTLRTEAVLRRLILAALQGPMHKFAMAADWTGVASLPEQSNPLGLMNLMKSSSKNEAEWRSEGHPAVGQQIWRERGCWTVEGWRPASSRSVSSRPWFRAMRNTGDGEVCCLPVHCIS